jgi:hypothetical protein
MEFFLGVGLRKALQINKPPDPIEYQIYQNSNNWYLLNYPAPTNFGKDFGKI